METLTVREASVLARLSAHTLRYYERAGLIEPVARTSTGHRRCARADLEHLQFPHCLRATVMRIRQMQGFAALVRQGHSARPAALALLEKHQAEVADKCRTMARPGVTRVVFVSPLSEMYAVEVGREVMN